VHRVHSPLYCNLLGVHTTHVGIQLEITEREVSDERIELIKIISEFRFQSIDFKFYTQELSFLMRIP
jgi:hypothetical protein